MREASTTRRPASGADAVGVDRAFLVKLESLSCGPRLWPARCQRPCRKSVARARSPGVPCRAEALIMFTQARRIALPALALLATCIAASPGWAKTVVVTASGMSFSPSTVNLDVGDSVMFQNNGGFHN